MSEASPCFSASLRKKIVESCTTLASKDQDVAKQNLQETRVELLADAVGCRKVLIEIRPLIDRRETECGGRRMTINARLQLNPEAPSSIPKRLQAKRKP
jgi:hypothetical protein